MNLYEQAALLGSKVDGVLLVDQVGNPLHVGNSMIFLGYLDGLVDSMLNEWGLRAAYATPLRRDLIANANVETATGIPEGEQVVECRAPNCARRAAATKQIGVVCLNHLNWKPDPIRCSCEVEGEGRTFTGNHHSVECAMFLPGAGALETWVEEAARGK